MRRRMAAALAVVCVCLGSAPGARAEEAAVKAAEQWLAMVDAGQYAESWQAAAPYFQNAISSEQWQAALTSARTPLGALVSRTQASGVAHTSLPGAPDGKYFVIQYRTTFANKQNAVETVTPMQGPDGTWKVSGYYIK